MSDKRNEHVLEASQKACGQSPRASGDMMGTHVESDS